MSTTPTKSTKLVVRRWDRAAALSREALPVIRDTFVDLPVDHDAAREAAKKRAVALTNAKRVRGVSALVAGGFSVAVEL